LGASPAWPSRRDFFNPRSPLAGPTSGELTLGSIKETEQAADHEAGLIGQGE
jgi:hypothetical protein